MKRAARILGQLFVGAFFFWHAAAVAIYAIPMGTNHVIMSPVRAAGIKVFAPYVLSLSQWQQWNLFSPDPLRRVSRYRIERHLGSNKWQTVQSIVPGMYGQLRHANRFKLYIGMLERDQSTYNSAVLRHFLLSFCEPNHIPGGTAMRIMYVQYIVPRPGSLLAAFRPGPWPPEYIETESDPSFCP
jgi:hypothetical protein